MNNHTSMVVRSCTKAALFKRLFKYLAHTAAQKGIQNWVPPTALLCAAAQELLSSSGCSIVYVAYARAFCTSTQSR
eukprot:scaffold159548_cov22-Tisochrysis_lutea.AAC.4